MDGADIGREVRTDIIESSAQGNERFVLSHLVKNEKMGKVLFQSILVRSERTVAETGSLLKTSFTKKDQVSVDTVQVYSADPSFKRKISIESSYKKNSVSESDIPLTGSEVIGFRLIDTCRKQSSDMNSPPRTISYFDANINSPMTLSLSSPSPKRVEIDGQQIDGRWITVSDTKDNRTIVKMLFDDSGTLWKEVYPDLHESRVRLEGPFSLPTDTSELIVGLRSNAYIYDPNIASRATYHLTSTPDRLDKLDMLSDPLNQTVSRISDNKLELIVHSGAPDGTSYPIDADLGSSFYIRPEDPSIKNALLYLKSGGKKGDLDEMRRLNATSVIARSSLIKNSNAFWSNNDNVASLLMNFVSAILPDKRHTFSMSNAVDTLHRGGGDCTEHAVLFASLMRSHGIPTRLITGMLLMPGGLWAYHMWNAYWDGGMWQSIDPSTKTFRPGALYVSLGRGASVFKDVRDRLADFMWRTFSGVSFDLVDAVNDGESLFLARPVGADGNLGETALFNAVVLSESGDHIGALHLIDENISKSARSITVKLMRIELIYKMGNYKNALEIISELRRETSAPENVTLLNRLEFYAHLHLGNFEKAQSLLDIFCSQFPPHKQQIYKAEFLFYSGKRQDAVSLIDDYLSTVTVSDEIKKELIIAYLSLVSKLPKLSNSQLKKAFFAGKFALNASHYVNSDVLYFYSRILSKMDQPLLSKWYINHALILSPKDKTLHEYLERFPKESQCPQ